MIKFKKIKLNKIKDKLKKLPRNLTERAFLTFLGLLFFGLIIGGIVFYNYVILVQKSEPEIGEKLLQFKEKNYDNALRVWQEREERFKETDLKQYSNPFRVD